VRPDERLSRQHDPNGKPPAADPEPGWESDLLDEQGVSTRVTPGTGRKVKISAAVVALALLAGFFVVHFLKASARSELSSASRAAASRPLPVDVVVAGSATGTRPLKLPGQTAAWYESIIYARVSGYVAKWYVDIGDHVRRGQTLAAIDTPELDAELTAARAELTSALAQVKVREAEAEFAKTTYERWRDSPKGVVSEQEREAKKADYDSSVAKLNAARAEVALDQAKVDHFAAMTQFKQVTAPFDGTITERRIDIGNLVTAGSTAGNTSLYRMSQDDPLRVFVDVPQSAAGELMKLGVPVQIRAASVPNRIFDGKITRTANAINPQARTLRVEIDIPNPDRALVPGMYVEVSFQLQTGGMVQVPAAALVFRASGPEVAVVDNSGRVSFRQVTIARDDGNFVELGSGISPGEQIALNISGQISEGDKVHVNESGNAPSPGNASPATALQAR
jgi:membrane fusion protein, multidrug efflux system